MLYLFCMAVVFLCAIKGYRSVIIEGKTVKVSFHKLPDVSSRYKWLHTMIRDVGMAWPCFLAEQLHSM